MTDLDVLCVGLLVADVMGKGIDDVPDWDRLGTFDHIEHHVGGCAANTGTDLAMMGLKIGVAGCVGRDAAGDFLRKKMSEQTIDTSGIIEHPSISTSYTFIMIHSDGRRRYIHHVGANAGLSGGDIPGDLLKRSRILHVGGSFLMPGFDGDETAGLLMRAKTLGLVTSLDTAFNPDIDGRALIEPCLPHLDIFIPSIEEAEAISGRKDPEQIMDFLDDFNIPILGIKLGTDGCLVQKDGVRHQHPIFKVDAVDVSGAGDAFMAGFLYGYLQDWDTERAARFANAASAHCVQAIGCSAGLRPAGEILEFMESYQ